jgi:hypothetical protein|tara:strand:+ start:236 stop:445 length:210 start_codon:yes stop_codon:yes gene_type:complete
METANNMDQSEQQMAFQEELNSLINRYSQEFELTYVSMIGVLEIQKLELAHYLFTDEEYQGYEEEEDYE